MRPGIETKRATLVFLTTALLMTASGLTLQADATGQLLDSPGSMSANNTGVGVNGNANDSSINNNQNSVNTGDNTNVNVVSPTVVAPNQAASSGGLGVGGTGGNAVLMMPRNPLPLANAAAGRSNFGLQFGLQNNPILGSLGGRQSGLGWFMQAGVTVPFGKIPDMFRSGQNSPMDTARQEQLDRQRNVLGAIKPSGQNAGDSGEKKVKGHITGISAYNYSALPTGKLSLPLMEDIGEVQDSKFSQPKLVALVSAQVFNKPLHTGEKVGEIQVGQEYPYLGHTRSGWVKVLLQNGSTGWTSTRFEYIKQDFTEIDDLAIAPMPVQKAQVSPVSSAIARPPQAQHAKHRG